MTVLLSLVGASQQCTCPARPNGQFVAERVARFIGKTALAGEVSLGGREPKALPTVPRRRKGPRS